MRAYDLAGQRFGKLVVLERAGLSSRKSVLWRCRCDCGNECLQISNILVKNRIVGCGCGQGNPTHGHTRRNGKTTGSRSSPTFISWTAMLSRCNAPSNASYGSHGARGVVVCDRWQFGENGVSGFECFLADMGERPSRAHTVDRYPDNDGDYEPDNCRWATKRQQANNRRDNWVVVYQGRSMSLTELTRETGLGRHMLSYRLGTLGMSLEDAIAKPSLRKTRLTIS